MEFSGAAVFRNLGLTDDSYGNSLPGKTNDANRNGNQQSDYNRKPSVDNPIDATEDPIKAAEDPTDEDPNEPVNSDDEGDLDYYYHTEVEFDSDNDSVESFVPQLPATFPDLTIPETVTRVACPFEENESADNSYMNLFEDVLKVHKFLNGIAYNLRKGLVTKPNKKMYCQFQNNVLARLTLFNKCQGEYIESFPLDSILSLVRDSGNFKLDLSDHDFSQLELQMINFMSVAILRGKMGRYVFVLIPDKIYHDMLLLIEYRSKYGPTDSNPFLFGKRGPGRKFFSASRVLTSAATKSMASNPTLLTTNILHDYVVSCSQMLTLSEIFATTQSIDLGSAAHHSKINQGANPCATYNATASQISQPQAETAKDNFRKVAIGKIQRTRVVYSKCQFKTRQQTKQRPPRPVEPLHSDGISSERERDDVEDV